jgi:hypothetical protein
LELQEGREQDWASDQACRLSRFRFYSPSSKVEYLSG